MKCKEIIEKLERKYSPAFAEGWDNVGLLAGSKEKEVKKVFLALDVTDETLEAALSWGADLMITHHPLIFSGMKRVVEEDFIGRRIIKLLVGDISYYAMHTNFDVMGMAAEAAEELHLLNPDVLEVTYEDSISHEGLGRIGELPEHMTLRECAQYVKDVFRIPEVRVYGDPESPVVMTAILPGSGKDEVDAAIERGADVLITGDITHHVGLDAVEKGISLIDAGHYGVEKMFVPYMRDYLKREMPYLTVICAPEKEAFTVI